MASPAGAPGEPAPWTHAETEAALKVMARAIEETSHCPFWLMDGDEACDGLDGCDDCLREAAVSVLAALNRAGDLRAAAPSGAAPAAWERIEKFCRHHAGSGVYVLQPDFDVMVAALRGAPAGAAGPTDEQIHALQQELNCQPEPDEQDGWDWAVCEKLARIVLRGPTTEDTPNE